MYVPAMLCSLSVVAATIGSVVLRTESMTYLPGYMSTAAMMKLSWGMLNSAFLPSMTSITVIFTPLESFGLTMRPVFAEGSQNNL